MTETMRSYLSGAAGLLELIPAPDPGSIDTLSREFEFLRISDADTFAEDFRLVAADFEAAFLQFLAEHVKKEETPQMAEGAE